MKFITDSCPIDTEVVVHFNYPEVPTPEGDTEDYIELKIIEAKSGSIATHVRAITISGAPALRTLRDYLNSLDLDEPS